MIVITGPGRSGTSYIAALYRQLGFDPGGVWRDDVNAGWENNRVVTLNMVMADDLGMTLERPRVKPWNPRVDRLRMRIAAKRGPRPLDWRRLPAVVEQRRSELREVAKATVVAKDPKFCWTLPLWLAAGANIEHVVVTVRALSSTIASRQKMLTAWGFAFSESQMRDAFSYALGMLIFALHEHDVPHSVVKYPDLVDDASMLYNALQFPEPVDERRFQAAVDVVRRPELVHV